MQAAPTAPNCDLAQNSERSYSQRQGSVFSRCPLVMCSYSSEGAGRLTSSSSFWQCSGEEAARATRHLDDLVTCALRQKGHRIPLCVQVCAEGTKSVIQLLHRQ